MTGNERVGQAIYEYATNPVGRSLNIPLALADGDTIVTVEVTIRDRFSMWEQTLENIRNEFARLDAQPDG